MYARIETSIWDMLTAVPSRWEPLGYLVLLVTLAVVTRFLLRPVWPAVWDRITIPVVVLTALAGMVLVLAIQWLAQATWMPKSGPLALLRMLGWGYAEIDNPSLNFQQHLLAWIAGVGILEESIKFFLGLSLAAWYSDGDEEPTTLRRHSACLVLAGLAFGAGEAVWEFRRYSLGHAPLEAFLLRGAVLVPLHGAWSLLAFHTSLLREEDLDKAKPGEDASRFFQVVLKVVIAGLPVAVLHGLYDASVQEAHPSPELALVVAGASLASALSLLIRLARTTGQDAGTK
jgi:hypothetical protein